MHIIVFNWAFILLVCWGLGWWLRMCLKHWLQQPFAALHPTLHLLLGLATLVTFCQLISFSQRISVEANITLTLLSLTGIICYIKQAGAEVLGWLQRLKKLHFSTWLALLAIAAIALLKTVSPTDNSDECSYHLPLTRWIEHFPVVPGIANIEDRMGFNPSKYIADAFFSVPYLFEGGLYELNSILFLLFNGYFLTGYDRLVRGKFDCFHSSLLSTIAVIFLWRKYLSALDADYLNIFLGLVLLILLIKKIEQNTLRLVDETTTMLTLLFSFLLTVKFSSIIWALPLTLHWLIVARKKGVFKKYWLKTFTLACLLLLPWLARNYQISGYPVYPIYWLNVGSPDWKVRPETAKAQYEYVEEFAKTEVVQHHLIPHPKEKTTLHDWLPGWLKRSSDSLTGMLVLGGIPLATLVLLVLLFLKKAPPSYFLLEGLLAIALLFWFFKFPSARLGWGLLLVFVVLAFSLAFKTWLELKKAWFTFALGGWILIGLGRGVRASFVELPSLQYLLKPATVEKPDSLKKIELKGIPVQISGDACCGGTTPPCFTKDYEKNIQLRGRSVLAGFHVVKKIPMQ